MVKNSPYNTDHLKNKLMVEVSQYASCFQVISYDDFPYSSSLIAVIDAANAVNSYGGVQRAL